MRESKSFQPERGLTRRRLLHRASSFALLTFAPTLLSACKPRTFPNVATIDGVFVDLHTGSPMVRQTSFGFDRARLLPSMLSNIVTVESLNTREVVKGLNRVATMGGGTLQLPPGIWNVERGLKDEIPSNIILQGSGRETTRLVFEGSGHAIHVLDRENIVIRDIALDCQARAIYGLNFEYAENVMVERCNISNAQNSNIRFRFAKNFTTRFCVASGARDFHGITVKDIFENGQFRDHAYCVEQFNQRPHTYGSLFSQNHTIYSNHCFQNGGNGINDHGIFGEISGNVMERNGFGGKSFDGRNLILNNNTFRGNAGRGYQIYGTVPYSGRAPGYLVFSENRFLDNGSFDLGLYKNGGYGEIAFEGPVILRNNLFRRKDHGEDANIVNQLDAGGVMVYEGSRDLQARWRERNFTLIADDNRQLVEWLESEKI